MFYLIRLGFIGLICIVLSLSLRAQEASPEADAGLISLEATTLNMQTGSDYEVSIVVEDISELWLADIELQYDPEAIYIYGTQSRQAPITVGDFFGSENVFVANNELGLGRMRLIVSLVAPAEVASGSGLIGSFRIFPLRSGDTTIDFANVEITTVIQERANGEITSTETRIIPVAISNLRLSITGENRNPPVEATATAIATQDAEVIPAVPESQNFTPSSQLPERTETVTSESSIPMLMIVALGLIFAGVLIAGVLLGAWASRRK